jgi:hypothetical protein
MTDDNKKALLALFEDHLGKKEFVKAFENVVTRVQAIEKRLVEDMKALVKTVEEKTERGQGETTENFEALKTELLAGFEAEIVALRNAVSDRLTSVDNRMREVRDGLDADPQAIKEALLKEIKLPEQKEQLTDTPEDIRNKLEVLQGDERLDASAIKGLRTALRKLDTRLTSMSGSMSLAVGHWPRHETFTMDGVATSVSLTQGGVGAQGTALIVRYQGQTLDLTTHYTVDGNKITFVGFTPENGTIISITYWP